MNNKGQLGRSQCLPQARRAGCLRTGRGGPDGPRELGAAWGDAGISRQQRAGNKTADARTRVAFAGPLMAGESSRKAARAAANRPLQRRRADQAAPTSSADGLDIAIGARFSVEDASHRQVRCSSSIRRPRRSAFDHARDQETAGDVQKINARRSAGQRGGSIHRWRFQQRSSTKRPTPSRSIEHGTPFAPRGRFAPCGPQIGVARSATPAVRLRAPSYSFIRVWGRSVTSPINGRSSELLIYADNWFPGGVVAWCLSVQS